jgi:protein-L-isoaspartate O-methyltransferase
LPLWPGSAVTSLAEMFGNLESELRIVSKILRYRPRVEAALSALDKYRLKLPVVNLAALFDDFDAQQVILTELPYGPWSSPIVDTVMLAKITLCLKPSRVLEVGSHRGHTAKLLAAHTPPDTRIVALDRDTRHGAAYRNSPLAAKIERRIGDVCSDPFLTDPTCRYDLIFLDADHTYGAVKRHTQILLPHLAHGGIFVWHDYANWGRFSKQNGVPEYLHELSASHPVVAVGGSWLAAYAPVWSTPKGAQRLSEAKRSTASNPPEDAWTADSLRG